MATVRIPVVGKEENCGGSLSTLLATVCVPVVGDEEDNRRMAPLEMRNLVGLGLPGIEEVQKILDTPTHPAALYLKKMKISAEKCVRLNLMSQLNLLPRIPRIKYGKRKGLTEEEKEMNTKERNKEHSKLTRQRRRIYRLCTEAYKTGLPISDHLRHDDHNHHFHHHRRHMDNEDVDSDSGDDESFSSDLQHVSDPGNPSSSSPPRSSAGGGSSSAGASSWSLSSLSYNKDHNLPPKKRAYVVSQLPIASVPFISASPLTSMMSQSQADKGSDQHEDKGSGHASDTTSHSNDSSMMIDEDDEAAFEYPNHHASSDSVTTLPECDSLTSDLSLR